MDKFAKIIINHKSNQTDMEYTYGILESMYEKIWIGSRVIVPFGQGNRPIEGFVVDIIDHIDIPKNKIKYIQRVVDHILSKEMIELCKWMKEEYMCKFIDAIGCVMPTGKSLKLQKYIILSEHIEESDLFNYDLSNKEYKIMNYLIRNKKIQEEIFMKTFSDKDTKEVLKKLKEKKLIQIKNHFKSHVNPSFKKMIKLCEKENVLECISNRAIKQREVVSYLLSKNQVEWNELRKETNVSLATIQALEKKGIVRMIMVQNRRDPYEHMDIEKTYNFPLTKEQMYAMEKIVPFIKKEMHHTFLIHGVTGSGKTEVYMRLIDEVLKKSKEAIVLVPEISLTTQMIERFKGRFGNQVAILHSKLSLGERYDEWARIKEGEVKIVIGARSAVFAPFRNLGIIIVDEEHEYTYKSEYTPKYHAIDVAKFRCQKNNAILVLGSATPSLESYTKGLEGEYEKIEMLDRFNKNPLPKVEIVDMREELERGNKSIFSKKLYDAIEEKLNKKEQIILFLNRRGYSTFISCRKCGYVVKCPHCDISLTYHAQTHKAQCHYCGFIQNPPSLCPQCNSKYIKYFGVGTEKIERITKKYFPHANVARLDLDTTTKKGSMDQIIKKFKKRQLDILIGTQMIAKGLDFPNVTLVGVIAGDTSLNLPDFRAAEKTFQLITQVAGRAGRGDLLGNVIVQTYEPDHFSIQAAKYHDYKSFYHEEILLRKEFLYPPYTVIFTILFSGDKEKEVIEGANDFTQMLKNHLLKYNINSEEIVFGAHPAPLSKIKEKYRWQTIIKCKLVDQKTIKGIINDMRYHEQNHFSSINISIDINPFSMM
ncbi:primosomal protein N' [Inediibacterium massiliense]|uniref:primosomal protein N' n=1 Tax=Inediibacterium massiliense TaxID=1658111 RepID=UPI0006B5BA37|nr:primosomal protein N' [Inediibacterium massiliense]